MECRDKAKNWEEFLGRLRAIAAVPHPMLVFEFLPKLSGISYQMLMGEIREEYLYSSLLVRDRIKLKGSEVWRKHGSGFKKQFIVGCGGYWYYCPASVWSPSVDAEFFLDILSNLPGVLDAESILDLGCGTGVLGLGAAHLARRVTMLNLVDSNKDALASAAINAACHELHGCDILIGTQPSPADFDIGLTAPYYFPVEKDAGRDPLAAICEAGRHTADMVRQCADVCRRVLFIYSSVSEAEFRDRLNMPFNILGQLTVPFSLGDNVSNLQFLNAAIDSDRLLVQPRDESFLYAHTITVGVVGND